MLVGGLFSMENLSMMLSCTSRSPRRSPGVKCGAECGGAHALFYGAANFAQPNVAMACSITTTKPHGNLSVFSLPMAPQTKQDRSFSALTPALSEWIIEAVDSMGFVKTTPVQHAAIPMFMKNSDVVVEAVTGSGKTLS